VCIKRLYRTKIKLYYLWKCHVQTDQPWNFHTKHFRPSGVVSQLVEAYARGEYLTGAGWRFILSDRFCCVPECGVPLNHESKTEDTLFLIFKSVSRTNTVNMNTPPPVDNDVLEEHTAFISGAIISIYLQVYTALQLRRPTSDFFSEFISTSL
jgi:hypothetical protein